MTHINPDHTQTSQDTLTGIDRSRLMATYTGSKLATSLGYHASFAMMTGGFSLLATLPMSAISYISRHSGDILDGEEYLFYPPHSRAERSGHHIEVEKATENLDATAQGYGSAALRGAFRSVWQAASRPVAWTAQNAAAAVDSAGYAVNDVRLVADLLQGKDQSLPMYGEEKHPWRLKNTVRDKFMQWGSIAPNGREEQEIRASSMLSPESQRPAYPGRQFVF